MDAEATFKSKVVEKPKDCEILRSRKKHGNRELIKVKYHGFELNIKAQNNTVLLKNGMIINIEKMFTSSLTDNNANEIRLIGKTWKILQSAFNYPTDSSSLSIFKVEQTCEEQVEYCLSEVKSKILLLKIYELSHDNPNIYAVPFLHE